MRVNNTIGHPIWCTGSRQYLLMAGESDVPDEIVLELANATGQLKQYIDAGLITITSVAPLSAKKVDEDAATLADVPKAKSKKG